MQRVTARHNAPANELVLVTVNISVAQSLGRKQHFEHLQQRFMVYALYMCSVEHLEWDWKPQQEDSPD